MEGSVRVERKIRADGDTWSARLGRSVPGPDTRVVLFFCTTTDQRPYRVVEVPADELPDEAALAGLSDDELKRLFRATRSMDYPRTFHSYGPSPS